MLVPQNGEQVYNQMIVVQNHIKDVSDSFVLHGQFTVPVKRLVAFFYLLLLSQF